MSHGRQDAQGLDQETSQRSTYPLPHGQHASHNRYEGITLRDQSRMIAGNVYGDVHLSNVDYRKVILDSLHFEGMERYHQRPLDSYPGTFEWLFDEGLRMHTCDFSSWKPGRCNSVEKCQQLETDLHEHASRLRIWLETSNDVFWVHGKAGSGKSTFMKFLSDHEQTKSHLRKWASKEVTLIAFFFWAAGSELEKSYLGLLRSLMYQLLFALPDLIESLFPDRWATLARWGTCKIPWTEKELLKATTQLLRPQYASKCFCFLIDGLDEFEGDHQDLLDAIHAMNKSSSIKICVSSRPWSIFRKTYGSSPNLHMAVHELTKRDIDLYVTTRFEASTSGILSHGKLRQLGDAVRKMSEGVFLWATLAVRDLRRGINEDDDMDILWERLANYPSELQDFFQHIFDKIDPCYTRFTGRLLLLMIEEIDTPALVGVPILEEYTAEGRFRFDHTWSPKSDDELYKMAVRGIQCASKWCKDILQPIDIAKVHEKCRPKPGSTSSLLYYCPAHESFSRDVSFILSFGHRTIYQYVIDKSRDGTLSELVGPAFDAQSAELHMIVGISRFAVDLRSFVDFLAQALFLWVAGMRAPQKIRDDDDFADRTRECLVALDQIGQNIFRPAQWPHWTQSALAEPIKKPRLKLLKRMPVGCQYSSFMAYMLGINHDDTIYAHLLFETHLEVLTRDQKQFLVEISLVPGLYDFDLDAEGGLPKRHVQEDIHTFVLEALRSGLDVNKPTRRSGCRFDYSVWQFFLAYLAEIQVPHDSVLSRQLEFDIVVSIFRTFIEHGADPFALVASVDLELDSPMLARPAGWRIAAFLSVADVLEHLDATYQAEREEYDEQLREVWTAGLFELKQILAQTSARRFARSHPMDVLPTDRFPARIYLPSNTSL